MVLTCFSISMMCISIRPLFLASKQGKMGRKMEKFPGADIKRHRRQKLPWAAEDRTLDNGLRLGRGLASLAGVNERHRFGPHEVVKAHVVELLAACFPRHRVAGVLVPRARDEVLERWPPAELLLQRLDVLLHDFKARAELELGIPEMRRRLEEADHVLRRAVPRAAAEA